jgi:Trk K+ transport system NAD-binding subunit
MLRSSKVAGNTLRASGLLDDVGTSRLLGIRGRDNGRVITRPAPETILQPGDLIIVQGGSEGAGWGLVWVSKRHGVEANVRGPELLGS